MEYLGKILMTIVGVSVAFCVSYLVYSIMFELRCLLQDLRVATQAKAQRDYSAKAIDREAFDMMKAEKEKRMKANDGLQSMMAELSKTALESMMADRVGNGRCKHGTLLSEFCSQCAAEREGIG
jgi:mannitol-specific phosphotransferase system IIBC component